MLLHIEINYIVYGETLYIEIKNMWKWALLFKRKKDLKRLGASLKNRVYNQCFI